MQKSPPLLDAARLIIHRLIEAAQKKETRQLATNEPVDWRTQDIVAEPVIESLREEINEAEAQIDELKERLETAPKSEQPDIERRMAKLQELMDDKHHLLEREKELGIEMVGIEIPPNIATAGSAYLVALNLLIKYASKQLAETGGQPHIELAFNEGEYIAECVCKGGISKDDSHALPPDHLRDIQAILLEADPECERGLDADELAKLQERRKPYQDLSNPAHWKRFGTMVQSASEHAYHIENVTSSPKSLAHELAFQMANDYDEDKYPGQVKTQYMVKGEMLDDKAYDELVNARKRQPTEFTSGEEKEILVLKGTAAEQILGALGVNVNQIQEPSRNEGGGRWAESVFKPHPPQFRQF